MRTPRSHSGSVDAWLAVLLAALNLLLLGVYGDDELTRRAVAEAGSLPALTARPHPSPARRRPANVAFCWRYNGEIVR